MKPRLKLDIGFKDLLSVFMPVAVDEASLRLKIAHGFGGDRPLVAGLSVRTLFDAALTTLIPELGAGSIVMSAVNIETMRMIAESHGLDVHAVDIVSETLLPTPQALEQALKDSGARIVVIAQLYGAVSDLKPLAEVCRRHEAVLIEDAAQAFCGDFHRGDPAADLSLFSFGPVKRATALGGAVAVIGAPERAEAMSAILNHWPMRGEGWLRARAVKIVGLKLASWPLIYGLIIRVLEGMGKDPDAIIGRLARGFSVGNILTQIRYRPPRALLRLLARRLGQGHDLRKRRNRAIEVAIGLPKGATLLATEATKNAYWVMPVVCGDPDEVVVRARRQGIDVTRGATSLRAFGSPRQAPAAHNLIRRVVYWPL
ncbi:DegT/DnrJ/EryC1/StrS family aminotransferase [Asticcacaulis sp. ZE23SCel15]|uniref:DegT/DnrJ/EryC1/StrS family aminotransferase n=1 Tax=Asticcacaulis sp. ZE23SCel15 TaxID=3059027 RepID=UPI00265F2900|nr:DegT/DnrJ/EryC1/StrS family aminotransferase [Asticcacaulis sp. ZE23SCel15]WKL58779.1 DegT/DnrJ/EryC1/StrS family aminotransferase [Asticcacaulis sp. ZE23SCel15]